MTRRKHGLSRRESCAKRKARTTGMTFKQGMAACSYLKGKRRSKRYYKR